MNEVNRARWKLLGGIFLVIILIHIVAISCIVATHRTPEEEPTATQTQQTAAPAAQQQPAVPERQEEIRRFLVVAVRRLGQAAAGERAGRGPAPSCLPL